MSFLDRFQLSGNGCVYQDLWLSGGVDYRIRCTG